MRYKYRAGRERHRRRLALVLAVGVVVVGLAAAVPASAGYDEGLAAYQNQDYATALRELQPVADQGDGQAQRLLGLMYRDGQGVPQDAVRAYMWLDLAAANGQDNAASERDALAQTMTPDQKTEAQRQVEVWRLGSDSVPPPPPSDTTQSAEQPPPQQPTPEAPPPAETPPPAAAPPAATAPQPEAPAMTPAQIADLQWQLAVHGYDPGSSDGTVGPQTQEAIRRYQADAGLPVDGEPSQALLDNLQYAQPAVNNKAANQRQQGASGFTQSQLPPAPPPSPAAPPAPSSAGIPVAPDLLPIYTTSVQQELARRGYYQGPIDGRLGPETRAAIRRYQQDRGLPVTGDVTLEFVNYLRIITGGAS
jgi:peptidoglycan hydrolase-like protein with peptidoglycan-binding domain